MGVLICERTRDGDQTDRRERQAGKKACTAKQGLIVWEMRGNRQTD